MIRRGRLFARALNRSIAIAIASDFIERSDYLLILWLVNRRSASHETILANHSAGSARASRICGVPSRPGRSDQSYLPETAGAIPSVNSQFEHGQPRKVVDAVGWVFGIPKKIILWDRRAVNHRVSLETEQNLAKYLEANGLTSTKVRINQYDPDRRVATPACEQRSRSRLALHGRRLRHAGLHGAAGPPVRLRRIQPLHG